MKQFFIIILICSLIAVSCENEPQTSSIPIIEFQNISHNLRFDIDSSIIDLINISFSFEDGDGDLGGDGFSVLVDYIKLDGTLEVPIIPLDTTTDSFNSSFDTKFNSSNSLIEGTIQLQFPLVTTDFETGDLALFDIRIQDRSGNISNMIRTSPAITLQGETP